MIKATMVLEGGATRGVFTSGVLDYLMEKDVYLSHVIGVSAGSCNGVDYVSKQIGRTRDCMIHREKEYNYYLGLAKMVKKRSILDMDMVFDRYPNEIFPFDFDTYFASDIECEIVMTSCDTGKAEYKTENSDKDRLMKLCRASSSMPVVSPMAEVDGNLYLDGGLADSIPIGRAVKKGNRKIVLILTRNPGYRKKRITKGLADTYRRTFRSYPNVARAMIERNRRYNHQAEIIERLERQGKIFVIRPLVPTVSRLERNYDTLMDFYEHGYSLMKKNYGSLMKYLEAGCGVHHI